MTPEEKQKPEDLRSAFRVEMTVPVKYRFAKKVAPGEYKLSPYLRGSGFNFSGGGAGVKVGQPLPVGTLIYLRMKFSFLEDVVTATAVVVSRDPGKSAIKSPTQIHVRFLVIRKRHVEKIMAYVMAGGKSA